MVLSTSYVVPADPAITPNGPNIGSSSDAFTIGNTLYSFKPGK